ncbi:hypothetical protein Ahy_A05g023837 [Arachis hypogaea]|uniref:3-hydroxyisobutyryl-CoA hydrolase n=1 Tax=Arachis hypogaea TaxID=3818 RepID=A0A445D4L0_ARAHY|nr:hypothetical protein Ahy_A05g023837 [Arachis hypogaea]
MLNRPRKLNSLNHEMVSQLLRSLRLYENDSSVKLVILKGNAKAFCSGGDVLATVTCSLTGHWTYPLIFYRKALTLNHLVATYKKLMVCLIDGVAMGGGATLSMNATFRIITENAIFAMPEVHIGHFPDAGASYFLSRLPGYFGEYLGLTGTRLKGAEMLACGLATHFIPSMRLQSLENALQAVTSSNVSTIATLIETFANKAYARKNSSFMRIDSVKSNNSKQIGDYKQMFFQRNCGRYNPYFGKYTHQGSRAKLFDKDNKPKWEPSKLELVSEEMVDQCFKSVNHDEWERLQLPDRSNNSQSITSCKL